MILQVEPQIHPNHLIEQYGNHMVQWTVKIFPQVSGRKKMPEQHVLNYPKDPSPPPMETPDPPKKIRTPRFTASEQVVNFDTPKPDIPRIFRVLPPKIPTNIWIPVVKKKSVLPPPCGREFLCLVSRWIWKKKLTPPPKKKNMMRFEISMNITNRIHVWYTCLHSP